MPESDPKLVPFEGLGLEWGVQTGWSLRTLSVLLPQGKFDEAAGHPDI
jgi:hypothetical protein